MVLYWSFMAYQGALMTREVPLWPDKVASGPKGILLRKGFDIWYGTERGPLRGGAKELPGFGIR